MSIKMKYRKSHSSWKCFYVRWFISLLKQPTNVIWNVLYTDDIKTQVTTFKMRTTRSIVVHSSHHRQIYYALKVRFFFFRWYFRCFFKHPTNINKNRLRFTLSCENGVSTMTTTEGNGIRLYIWIWYMIAYRLCNHVPKKMGGNSRPLQCNLDY